MKIFSWLLNPRSFKILNLRSKQHFVENKRKQKRKQTKEKKGKKNYEIQSYRHESILACIFSKEKRTILKKKNKYLLKKKKEFMKIYHHPTCGIIIIGSRIWLKVSKRDTRKTFGTKVIFSCEETPSFIQLQNSLAQKPQKLNVSFLT